MSICWGGAIALTWMKILNGKSTIRFNNGTVTNIFDQF
jgi:hypothetical protein